MCQSSPISSRPRSRRRACRRSAGSALAPSAPTLRQCGLCGRPAAHHARRGHRRRPAPAIVSHDHRRLLVIVIKEASLNYAPSTAGHLPLHREGIMETIYRIIAVAAIAFGLPASAEAAQTDPEVIIYRFPGVRDDGSLAFV